MSELYHYCSNETLISIVQNKSIRLSALSTSNDSLEGKIVFKLLEDLAREAKVPDRKIKKLNDTFYFFQQAIDTLGLCLSEEGDLLSQWRGYSEDGKGVSIGFSKEYLDIWTQNKDAKTIISLAKALYAYEDQMNVVRPLFSEIKSAIDEGALDEINFGTLLTPKSEEEIESERQKYFKRSNLLFMKVFPVIDIMYRLKNEAFAEEKEWRLRSIFLKTEKEESLFRSKDDRIIPFKVFYLPNYEIPVINKIFLGPKNKTPLHTVKCLLQQYGMSEVVVEVSKASYR